jgi:DNA repair protein RadA/Sms
MARAKTAFFCTDCGNESPRWQGQCPACGAWNTLAEEPAARVRADRRRDGAPPQRAAAAAPVRLRDVESGDTTRWPTGLGEFDFVLGGGVVPGSVVLVGGEPGIGKSTLLLQVAARLQQAGRGALYVSGEESAAQVRMRADRLAEPAGEVTFLGETELDTVLARAAERRPSALFVDSIQTVYSPDLEGAPGNVGQVRECAARLQRFAKEAGVAVFLVGHVTKGGAVAGPKTLEHIVDTVLYFEDAAGLDHRLLRATKNRFGSVDELGVFRMSTAGLVPVENPSAIFLAERRAGTSGGAVVATLEGSRPLLVEIQALCAPASYGAAQRVTTGFDRQRLAMLLAVLERRAALKLSQADVFLNVVGGVRITETAGDLAVAAAVASAALDRPVPADAIFVGEIGLGGEIRAVGQAERRLAEASRMGFQRAFVPERSIPRVPPAGLEPVAVRDVGELLRLALR